MNRNTSKNAIASSHDYQSSVWAFEPLGLDAHGKGQFQLFFDTKLVVLF